MGGRLVLSKEFPYLAVGRTSLDVDAGFLPKGLYSYCLKTNRKVVTGKLIRD